MYVSGLISAVCPIIYSPLLVTARMRTMQTAAADPNTPHSREQFRFVRARCETVDCGQIVPILLNRCQYHRLSVNYKHSNYCKTEMVYQIYKYTFHKTTNDLTGFLLWCDFIDALHQHNCYKHPLEKSQSL